MKILLLIFSLNKFHYHEMDANDLRKFQEKIAKTRIMLGEEHKRALDCEEPARRNARRSSDTKRIQIGVHVKGVSIVMMSSGRWT